MSDQAINKGVQQLFTEVPRTYELINHIFTFGLDIIWRKKMARAAAKGGGHLWLDVCSGTGETALNLKKLADNETKVIALDFCEPMLRMAMKKESANNIEFAIGEAATLPFRDETFDLITLSFATRNINTWQGQLQRTLCEFRRVLKKGGRFVTVETSQPRHRFLRRMFHFYVSVFIPLIGRAISGSKTPYRYLSQTIPHFYGAEEFAGILKTAGFSVVSLNRLLLGVSAIHCAVK